MLSINADPPVLCRVVENRSADVARLALRIEASRGIAGRYNLVVRKSDPAGTATMQQGGGFDLADLRLDAQLSVDASVQVDGRRISCVYDSTQDL
jgi:hypothetical protein